VALRSLALRTSGSTVRPCVAIYQLLVPVVGLLDDVAGYLPTAQAKRYCQCQSYSPQQDQERRRRKLCRYPQRRQILGMALILHPTRQSIGRSIGSCRGCWWKNCTISTEASGPLGSVYEPGRLPSDQGMNWDYYYFPWDWDYGYFFSFFHHLSD
jgi:hypothetical protein